VKKIHNAKIEAIEESNNATIDKIVKVTEAGSQMEEFKRMQEGYYRNPLLYMNRKRFDNMESVLRQTNKYIIDDRIKFQDGTWIDFRTE
jgi:hypothetical protein